MANDFYNHSGYPVTRAQGDSSSMRAQLAAIAAGFDKMPALSGNALRLVRVNAGATALESTNAIDGIAIGGSTPAAGAFTTLSSSGLATLASASVAGAFAANGGVTLGDASGDALTINPSAVTWANNPTHSGNHTFSGNVTVNGNTTIGNASGDTLTFAPSDVTWSNNPTHSGNHSFSGTLTGASTARFGGTTFGSLGVRDTGAYGGGAPSTSVDGFVLESSVNTGIAILTPNTASAQIRFGDPEVVSGAGISHVHSSDTTNLIGMLSGAASTFMTASAGALTVQTGWDLQLPNAAPTDQFSAGFRGVPYSSGGSTTPSNRSLVGRCYDMTSGGTFTVDGGVFQSGDVVSVLNAGLSSSTIAQGAGMTMRLAGTTSSGSRTIAARGLATIYFQSSSVCFVSGAGVS